MVSKVIETILEHVTGWQECPLGGEDTSLGIWGPHRHWNLGELFSNAVLHDAPQVEAVVWLIWYSGSLFLLSLLQLMLVLEAKTKPFNQPQRTKIVLSITFPSPTFNEQQEFLFLLALHRQDPGNQNKVPQLWQLQNKSYLFIKADVTAGSTDIATSTSSWMKNRGELEQRPELKFSSHQFFMKHNSKYTAHT